MVRWYSFGNLVRFLQSYLSGVKHGHPDHREALAAADTPADPGWMPYVDLAPREEDEGESWVDFMSDTGDGYDAVHAVAYVSEAPQLAGLRGVSAPLPRAQALLLGGDTAYPIADRATLRDRMLLPHHDARTQWQQPVRQWLAIPGNHDWYDDLRGFREAFVESAFDGEHARARAHFHTPQRRSYYAARLAHNWWVLAVDCERTGDLDPAQLSYFQRAIRYAGAYPQPRVIMISHDPLEHRDRPPGVEAAPPRLQELLDWLALQRAEVKLWLAGDLHFYRHDGAHGRAPDRIICGGGGAFLHPTHTEDPPPEGAPEPRLFPDPADSKRCARGGLLFPLHNLATSALLAVSYVCFFLLLRSGGIGEWLSWTFAGGLFVSALAFAATQGLLFAATVGLLHGAVQTALYVQGALRLQAEPLGWAAMAVIGGLIAPALFGWYLWGSLRFFRKHRNGAFSALRIPHFKSFLRMHVDPAGELHVYPIGIRHVEGGYRVHEQQRARPAHARRLDPADEGGPTFELIGGKPIRIPR
jgi:hypothetical protein